MPPKQQADDGWSELIRHLLAEQRQTHSLFDELRLEIGKSRDDLHLEIRSELARFKEEFSVYLVTFCESRKQTCPAYKAETQRSVVPHVKKSWVTSLTFWQWVGIGFMIAIVLSVLMGTLKLSELISLLRAAPISAK